MLQKDAAHAPIDASTKQQHVANYSYGKSASINRAKSEALDPQALTVFNVHFHCSVKNYIVELQEAYEFYEAALIV